MHLIEREFDKPLPPSLPLRNPKGGVAKNSAFAPLSDTERGWGRGQIILVELTLIEPHHSTAFWHRVERIVPDYLKQKQWLTENAAIYNL
ncbi:MAG: M48 family metallopeptidase [Nostoc sp.]|uniref:M48 metallopeptidase family protein n=1 Tax=Nostoc sp. TaxID=1180 RepID=UPI002FF7A975